MGGGSGSRRVHGRTQDAQPDYLRGELQVFCTCDSRKGLTDHGGGGGWARRAAELSACVCSGYRCALIPIPCITVDNRKRVYARFTQRQSLLVMAEEGGVRGKEESGEGGSRVRRLPARLLQTRQDDGGGGSMASRRRPRRPSVKHPTTGAADGLVGAAAAGGAVVAENPAVPLPPSESAKAPPVAASSAAFRSRSHFAENQIRERNVIVLKLLKWVSISHLGVLAWRGLYVSGGRPVCDRSVQFLTSCPPLALHRSFPYALARTGQKAP